ncbi:zinc ribbon domain-containing protein [Streptococcus dentapri]|uniref:Zinc ribbon domain-containing protein n=1 Tax=Streptococcus dentapri TaxID=573564 RepID=A0ABV8D057_9STRE
MATKEKWTQLFETVVGRKPSPEEFMAGKKTDFSPKEIRRIAGLDADAVNNADIQDTIYSDYVENESINPVNEKMSFEDSHLSQEGFSSQETELAEATVDFSDERSNISESRDKSQQDVWIAAFQKYVGRQPRPEEFLVGKAAAFDLTSVNQFLKASPKSVKSAMPRWKKVLIGFVTVLILAAVSAFIYGNHYYSREAVADRYLEVAGKDFKKQLVYEVWSDTKKQIKNSDLKYTDTSKVFTETDKDNLLKGSKMVQTGHEYLIFPKWKVAVDPASVKVSTNTKDLKITINENTYATSDSEDYSADVKRLYPGTYDFVANGKVNNQDIEVSLQEDLRGSSSESIKLDVKYLNFKLKSNISDGDVYVGSKKIGKVTNGQYSASHLAVTDSASVYVQKKFSDGTSIKSETASIESISDDDTLTLDAVGVLDRDTADDLITAAYDKLSSYAVDNTTPDDLDDIFQGGSDNSMYKDITDVIDTNTINAKNRKADSVTFSDVDVTSVVQTSKTKFTVNFTVIYDFYYGYDSDHKSSGDIKDKLSWSANVEYTGGGSASDDSYYEDSYSNYIITGSNGTSTRISEENTVK